jgi:uncharacterized RDD family membrane protein YckC
VNCQNCGAELQPGDSTCARCGTALTVSPPPLAGPWPRYWARSLDLTLWIMLCAFLLGIFAPQLLDAAPADERVQEQLLGLILLPFALAGDALTYLLFGNTPGKWAAGLRVRDVADQKLKPLRYLARNSRVYLHGLALGLGLISIVTLIHQYRRVRSGALSSWDERLESRVQHVRGGMVRTGVTATVTLTLAIAGMALGKYVEHLSPEDSLQWVASVANRGAPRMLDEHTRLDRVSVGPGLVLQYDYTLLDQHAGEAQETAFDAGALHEKVAKSVCEDLSFVFDQNGRVRFRYVDPDGKPLVDVEVSKADCTKKL